MNQQAKAMNTYESGEKKPGNEGVGQDANGDLTINGQPVSPRVRELLRQVQQQYVLAALSTAQINAALDGGALDHNVFDDPHDTHFDGMLKKTDEEHAHDEGEATHYRQRHRMTGGRTRITVAPPENAPDSWQKRVTCHREDNVPWLGLAG